MVFVSCPATLNHVHERLPSPLPFRTGTARERVTAKRRSCRQRIIRQLPRWRTRRDYSLRIRLTIRLFPTSESLITVAVRWCHPARVRARQRGVIKRHRLKSHRRARGIDRVIRRSMSLISANRIRKVLRGRPQMVMPIQGMPVCGKGVDLVGPVSTCVGVAESSGRALLDRQRLAVVAACSGCAGGGDAQPDRAEQSCGGAAGLATDDEQRA